MFTCGAAAEDVRVVARAEEHAGAKGRAQPGAGELGLVSVLAGRSLWVDLQRGREGELQRVGLEIRLLQPQLLQRSATRTEFASAVREKSRFSLRDSHLEDGQREQRQRQFPDELRVAHIQTLQRVRVHVVCTHAAGPNHQRNQCRRLHESAYRRCQAAESPRSGCGPALAASHTTNCYCEQPSQSSRKQTENEGGRFPPRAASKRWRS